MPSVNSRASAQPSMPSSEKDELYPFNQLEFQVNEVTNRCEGIKGPLSLFAPYPHEDSVFHVSVVGYLVKHEYHPVLEDQAPPTEVELERPITPIDEEITQPPNSYNKLAKLVRRRITAKTDSAYLGLDDQKELAAIIMGEVNGVWADYKTQVDDPFLSPEENRELQRRITVHIVTVCGQLFKHYIEKAHILQSRGVFSGPANMSRLKAQLSLDTNKFLNISTIRRYIVSDLRQESNFSPRPSKKERPLKERVPQAKVLDLSYKGLIATSRPKSKTKKFECSTPSGEIKQMNDNMPLLDTVRLETILRDFDPKQRSSLSVDEFGDQEFPVLNQGDLLLFYMLLQI
ncbi:hypothetical protein CAPTEDRAFT_210744 [Capitella teleta]|uniref:Uncharacterized protein n=1 Tax=Capitella teleta TaxID=283909 RepID=R7URC4_CAPTE|nr:hypothetical protein CAPTEDRAFT_210744 [Capitella teleta]|eukprot:ELU05966.1 hypothetical protein CAPTEDRAFT_210744 [Capitella teleta]